MTTEPTINAHFHHVQSPHKPVSASSSRHHNNTHNTRHTYRFKHSRESFVDVPPIFFLSLPLRSIVPLSVLRFFSPLGFSFYSIFLSFLRLVYPIFLTFSSLTLTGFLRLVFSWYFSHTYSINSNVLSVLFNVLSPSRRLFIIFSCIFPASFPNMPSFLFSLSCLPSAGPLQPSVIPFHFYFSTALQLSSLPNLQSRYFAARRPSEFPS